MLHATRHFETPTPRYYTPKGTQTGGTMTYRVAHDPTGDYRRGAEFTATQIGYMLADGTFDDGLVVERDGRRWTGKGGELVELQ